MINNVMLQPRVPEHVSPSPVQPSLHVHSYEPSLFLQAAFVSQGLFEHSLMSTKKMELMKYHFSMRKSDILYSIYTIGKKFATK